MKGDSEGARKYQLKARFSWAEHGLFLAIVNRLGGNEEEVAYQLLSSGLSKYLAELKGDLTDPDAQLAALVYANERRNRKLAELAGLLPRYATQPDEFAALCHQQGFDPSEVLAHAAEARTKTERVAYAKERDKCRAFLMGLLMDRENGMEVRRIMAYGTAAGFKEPAIRRSFEDIGATQHWNGRESFWTLPDHLAYVTVPARAPRGKK